MKPATLLRQTGPMIFGEFWRQALARELGVSVKTIQRYETGERDPPESVADDLRAVLVKHRDRIDALIAKAQP